MLLFAINDFYGNCDENFEKVKKLLRKKYLLFEENLYKIWLMR